MIFVSIIIPCFNQGHLLEDAFLSITNQGYSNFEIIIVDDGSNDNTSFISKSFIQSNKRIYYYHKQNGGLSSARNFGILKAKGDYIIFLDADDFLEPGSLKIINDFASSSKSLLIQFGWNYCSYDKNTIHYSVIPRNEPLLPTILLGNAGPVHSFCFHRTIIDKTGIFDEKLKSAEDWDFMIRVAKFGFDKKVLPQVLVTYRISNESMSRNAFRMYDALKEVAQRAIKKDLRLPNDLPFNKDYAIDALPGLKNHLLMCIGVSVMQNMIQESAELFQKETNQYQLKYKPSDFAAMCSYLSFRYRYSKEEVHYILSEIRPRFELFFKEVNPSPSFRQEAIKAVFSNHLKMANRYKWGLLAPIVNRITT